MDPEPEAPGSCSPKSPKSPGKGSPGAPPAKWSLHRRRGKGLHVRIWEYGGASWLESHIYSHWLEADCTTDGDHMDVHLPSVSVQGIMQLRGCLDHPKALCLDPPLNGAAEDSFLWDTLCSLLDGPVAVEARQALGKRRSPSKPSLEPSRPKSPALEMMQPEVGAECMDISICVLEGLQKGSSPILLMMRCEKPLDALRYAALVVCSSPGGPQALQAAREVAKALATAFVDERFVHEVSRVPPERPSHVVEALDRFLSTLTIVPTVHLREQGSTRKSTRQGSTRPGSSQQSAREPSPCPSVDVLLSDSLQHQMESLLCQQLGVPQPVRRSKSRADEEFSLGSHWKRCFVEVDCLDPATQEWRMTRQLRQGMEVDAGSGKKPHLPHVSAVGLAKIRVLSAPNNVALDVMASNGTAAVGAIVQQLTRAGLPSSASEAVASALRARASEGTTSHKEEALSEPLSPDVRRAESFTIGQASPHEGDLVAPCEEDDAFLILLAPVADVPAGAGITSACLRFSIPIEFAQCETPVRFLVVLTGPVGDAEEMSQVGNSLAALAVDEDLVGSLDQAVDEASFAAAMSRRLDDLPVMPRSHLEGRSQSHQHNEVKKAPTQSHVSLSEDRADNVSKAKAHDQVIQDHLAEHVHGQSSAPAGWCRQTWARAVKVIQKYSLPLVSGVLLALVWANVDDHSYHDVVHGYFSDDFSISGHKISLHFIVNDMFMCLFFGLAIKEVTEALLPGGSLSPLRRAANPLCATCGGIIGPIACYFILTLAMDAFGAFDDMECQVEVEGRRLGGGGGGVQFTGETAPCELSAILNGWGVPTATDISLAWMFALLIFGAGHPAINFLLLLAIVDDAIGMVIIAIFYGDKDKPFYEGKEWLGLVVAAALLAYALRRLRVRQWPVYVLVCGPISWLGLLKAHVHPALALVVVVPFMPATHAQARGSDHRGLGAWTSSEPASHDVVREMMRRAGTSLASHLSGRPRGTTMFVNMVAFLQKQENAPLHLFEHQLKLPVDIGMFFFGLANAGVKLGSVGGVTTCVLGSLIVGKTLGVAGFAILAHCCGFGLPDGIVMSDLFAMGALAGVGLTVALFVSNEAFTDPGLQGQAKMGALLSIGSAGFSWLISAVHKKFCAQSRASGEAVAEDGDDDEDEDDGFEEVITHEIIQQMWEFRRYKARGHELTVEQMARTLSKNVRSISKSDRPVTSESVGSDNVVRQISTPSNGTRPPGSARASGALEKLGPSRSERRRSSRKHATWATTHLRPPGTPGTLA